MKMKRQGFYSGKIYDEDYPKDRITECCKVISDDEDIPEKNSVRAVLLRSRCNGCNGCPKSQEG